MDAILLLEYTDESGALGAILHQLGCTVQTVHNLEPVIDHWSQQPADLCLLAQGEVSGHALEELRLLRAVAAVPIMVIADICSEALQVALYQAGADVVLVRPYSTRLLFWQAKALLQRSNSLPYVSLPSLTLGEVTLDPIRRLLTIGANPARHLTQLEFRLLYSLMTNVGQVLPAETIVEHVWGYSGEGERELVRGLVQRLRAKIEPDPSSPRYILTEVGIGYFFNADLEREADDRAPAA